MAIIDHKGISFGRRISRCSDLARLHWVYLYSWSNSFARIEVDYGAIRGTVYATFKDPPSEENLLCFFAEYHNHRLGFLYRHEGGLWCQFATPDKYLPRYKSTRCQNSPAPDAKEYKNWLDSYLLSLQQVQKTAENFIKFPLGVGVGIGVGVVVGVGEGAGVEVEKTTSKERLEGKPDNPKSLSPLDDDSTEKTATESPRAALGKLIEKSTGKKPKRDDLNQLEAILEDRGGMLAFAVDVAERVTRLRRAPTVAFFISEAQKFGSVKREPEPDPMGISDKDLAFAAALANGNVKDGKVVTVSCESCKMTGRVGGLPDGDFCTCQHGVLMKQWSTQKTPQAGAA